MRKIHQAQPKIVNKPLKIPSPENFGPHMQVRADALHRRGIFGAGVKVAIIDSGVDCTHPALGGGFGPGKKIGFGADLVGDAYNGIIPPQPKASPCTPCGVSALRGN